MKPIIGKTYLTEIPHEGGTLTFQHPAFKGTYGDIAEQIDKAKLNRPNSPQTTSLIYDAFQDPKQEYQSQIIQILKGDLFCEFTGNLYIPKSNQEINNGVILEHNPTIKNNKLMMNKKSLIKRLQENDPLVKFVPFGYKIGEQNLIELQKNPYIIARYDKEGAEKIAEIASKFKKNPKLWSFDFVDREITRMSALDRDWGFSDRLGVDGYIWDGGGRSHAFGVCPTEKGK